VKAKIEQSIHSWAVCVGGPAHLKLELAIESILRTIESDLQQHKVKLNENEFQDLIYFSLQKSQGLPRNLRFKTLSYLKGGIQREVQRPEYQQLKSCFRKHFKPVPWSGYGVFITAEVLPPILLILMIASMPGLAWAAPSSSRASSRSVIPTCTHLLKIDYAKSNLMLQDIKLQLNKMGVDYNKLPLQADFSVEKIRRQADCFAHTLAQFSTEQLNPSEEKKFLNTVLNDDTYMEPLYLILTYAQNEPLRYKITAKLAQRLYIDIHQASANNAHRLIRILGQAIMAIHPDKLPQDITKDEIIRMSDILSLYRRIAQSASAVNKQRLALHTLLETEKNIAPQPTPVKANSYYIQFLVVFTAMIGLVQVFMRFFNRTFPTPKANSQKATMLEKKNLVKMTLSSKPSAIKSSTQIAPPQTIVKKIPVQENLHTILTKLNELFLDLTIPNPYPLRWSEFDGAQTHLELSQEQYYYDTQGDGKVFGLSKVALSALAKEYCRNKLDAEERTILLDDAGLVLKRPLALRFNENTHSIKQCYAAFFKMLRQLANVYYPMDIQLDYRLEEFYVVFSLSKEASYEIESSSLTRKQFLQCVRNSLNLSGPETQFAISYQTIKARRPLPNEKEFLAMKKEACTKKEKEPKGQPGFFDPREDSNKEQHPVALSQFKNKINDDKVLSDIQDGHRTLAREMGNAYREFQKTSAAQKAQKPEAAVASANTYSFHSRQTQTTIDENYIKRGGNFLVAHNKPHRPTA
jgi:hypothetical protein